MSKSLKAPWILNYLLDVAITHGGDFISVPLFPAKRKAQLVKFTTHQIPGENTWIWARISDLAHTIPVRLSKAAMETFTRDPHFGGTLIHEYKTAFITIQNFRPMLARIPLGPTNQGMTSNAHLVLEIDVFDMKGAIGDETWGKPMDVERDKDIKLWVEGLRLGGGGGNVLQLQKLEREGAAAARAAEMRETTSLVNVQTTIRRSYHPVHVQPAQGAHPMQGQEETSGASARERNGQNERRVQDRRSRFKLVTLTMTDIMPLLSMTELSDPTLMTEPPVKAAPKLSARPTAPVQKLYKRRDALDFSSSPAASPKIAHAEQRIELEPPRPTTPTDWSPSQHGAQQPSPTSPSASSSGWKLQDSDDDSAPPGHGAQPSSPITASPIQVDESLPPTDSTKDSIHTQEQIEALVPSTQNTPYTTGYLTTTSISAPTPAQRPKPFSPSFGTGTLPSSSAPPALTTFDSSPISLNVARLRKGEGPASPPPSSNSYAVLTGPGRILVPNSDSSGTHSQPSQFQPPLQQQEQNGMPVLQMQSETLSGSAGLPEGLSQSQSQNLNESQARVQTGPLLQSQDNPVAQSLSYTSQSQSQPQNEAKRAAQVADIREEGEGEIVGSQYPEVAPDLTKMDVTEEDGNAEVVVKVDGENALGNAEEEEENQEEEEQEQDDAEQDEVSSDEEKDELNSDDEVMQVIEQGHSAAKASPEHHEDPSQEEAEVDELESDELESDDERIVNMIREANGSLGRQTSPPVVSPLAKEPLSPDTPPAKSGRHAMRRSPVRTSPISRTPSLPSEPDVFMDEVSFSTHMKHSALQRLDSHSREDLRPQAQSASATSVSVSNSSRPARRSSSVHVNAEAGPSTIISSSTKATKSTPTSPSKPSGRFLFHDPEVWAAPSFLRRNTKAEAKQPESVVPAAAPTQNQHVQDRALKRKRSLDEAKPPDSQQRPNKKPKRADADVESAPWLSPMPKLPASARPHFERPHRDTTPAAALAKTDSLTSTMSRIRQIDLAREPSVTSSTSSGRKKKGEKIAPSTSVSNTTGSECGSTSHPPEAARSTSKSNVAAVESSRRGEPGVRKRLKLGGFKLNLEFNSRENPGLVTWEVLSETLLAVRQRREGERQA